LVREQNTTNAIGKGVDGKSTPTAAEGGRGRARERGVASDDCTRVGVLSGQSLDT